MKFLSKCYIGLIFFLLYIPIVVLIVFSFNESGSLAEFSGFSFMWYEELFHDEEAFSALRNSLVLAVSSAAIATVLGTFGALGLHRMKRRYIKQPIMTLTNIPMMNPDIVTGVSMMLLFVAVATFLGTRDLFGFGTLLIAHVTFNLPYVILNVMPKLAQMDRSLVDAAMDLGCTPLQSFFKVTLPEIMPGVAAGAIMAFTMSLDDFVISYFVTGMDFVTLPVEIYSYTKKPIPPKIYAMFTLLFLLILVLMVVMNLLQLRFDKKKQHS